MLTLMLPLVCNFPGFTLKFALVAHQAGRERKQKRARAFMAVILAGGWGNGYGQNVQ